MARWRNARMVNEWSGRRGDEAREARWSEEIK